LDDKDVKYALIKAMVSYCHCRNLGSAGFFSKYPNGASPKEIAQFTREYNIWPGYGVCCNKLYGAYCEQHGLSWIEGNPLYYYGPAENLEKYWNYELDATNLNFYDLWGGCHWLAHFVLVLARKAFPKKKWSVLRGKRHTIVVDDHPDGIHIVMDILNFRSYSAKWSIDFVFEDLSTK